MAHLMKLRSGCVCSESLNYESDIQYKQQLTRQVCCELIVWLQLLTDKQDVQQGNVEEAHFGKYYLCFYMYATVQ
jgi:hypothetical protein